MNIEITWWTLTTKKLFKWKKYFQTNNISGFQVIWESSIFWFSRSILAILSQERYDESPVNIS